MTQEKAQVIILSISIICACLGVTFASADLAVYGKIGASPLGNLIYVLLAPAAGWAVYIIYKALGF